MISKSIRQAAPAATAVWMVVPKKRSAGLPEEKVNKMSIEFFLDGKAVTAEPGQTIMAVAKANGISIPGLCGEPRISKTTSCFVCVVKDKKTGKFLPSCSAFPSAGQEIEVTTPEVLEMRRTALNLLLSEHNGDCEAPCTLACPAHADVEEYVRAAGNGDFEKALQIIKERIPMPLTIGRVCPRFCEKQCRRNIDGEPVAINEFKRIAADKCYDSFMEDLPELCGKKVAVIGGGPAGLSAAYYLRKLGFSATIFDMMPAAGGMTRYGIPEYRMPKNLLDKEIAHFEKMGIAFEFGKKLGKNFPKLSPWQIYIITSEEEFEKLYGVKADKVRKLYNGMIKCNFYQYFKRND